MVPVSEEEIDLLIRQPRKLFPCKDIEKLQKVHVSKLVNTMRGYRNTQDRDFNVFRSVNLLTAEAVQNHKTSIYMATRLGFR